MIQATDGNGVPIWDIYSGHTWICTAQGLTQDDALADDVVPRNIKGLRVEPWYVGKEYTGTPELIY